MLNNSAHCSKVNVSHPTHLYSFRVREVKTRKKRSLYPTDLREKLWPSISTDQYHCFHWTKILCLFWTNVLIKRHNLERLVRQGSEKFLAASLFLKSSLKLKFWNFCNYELGIHVLHNVFREKCPSALLRSNAHINLMNDILEKWFVYILMESIFSERSLWIEMQRTTPYPKNSPQLPHQPIR